MQVQVESKTKTLKLSPIASAETREIRKTSPAMGMGNTVRYQPSIYHGHRKKPSSPFPRQRPLLPADTPAPASSWTRAPPVLVFACGL